MNDSTDALVDLFADAGVLCVEEGVLPEAVDEMTDRLAGRGCIGNTDLLGLCETCGAVRQSLKQARAGWHNPDKGGCPFGRAAVAAAHMHRVCRWARLRTRYRLGMIRPLDADLDRGRV